MSGPSHSSAAGEAGESGDLAGGVATIRRALAGLPAAPGVYRMLDRRGEALYVGKARSLRRRVANYTNPGRVGDRIARMISETVSLEVVITHTEVEALLLESNLIKRLRPRYNILLRDDKSFPYILIAGDHDWPRLTKYRGARNLPGEYFGPFASAGAVNRTLTALQRAFLLRSCSDSVFSGRTRPCLLYQIRRCAGPCVGRVSTADYAELVSQARDFLTGRSQHVQQQLAARMQQASDHMEYEKAAAWRDRIRALTAIQARQDINVAGLEDADVIAGHQAGGQTCVQVFFYRAGRHYGNRAHYPRHDRSATLDAVLAAFIGQFYDSRIPPPMVLVSDQPAGAGLLAEALSERAGRRVRLTLPKRGPKRRLIAMAAANAAEALARRMAESASQRRLLEGLAGALDLESPPRRIEVYDNSHIQGSQAVGGMIVAGPDGFVKGAARRFNIRVTETAGDDDSGGADGDRKRASPGDDYAMMREVLERRFSRALREDPDRAADNWPDLVLIDGGAGQLSVALDVLAELGLDDIPVTAIAKGPDRNAGRERLFMAGREPFSLDPRDPVLYFLQRLRDEAHRYAIGAHRARRAKALEQSALDSIPGIGASRKRALLHRFGSVRDVAKAGIEDLGTTRGISKTVARRIYDHFHGNH